MTFNYPIRVRVGLLLMLAFTLVSNVQLLRIATSGYATVAETDEITRYEAHFQELKKVLPPHGVVGYIADPNPESVIHDTPYFKRYVLTQYSLSPVIVVDNIEPELIIGNFHPATNSKRVSIPGLTLIKDFGDGVMLFRRRPQ